jgi:hypothetical protein
MHWRALAAVAGVMAMSSAGAACDLGSLKGDFWFVDNGTVRQSPSGGNVSFTPFVELGKVSYDGKGGATLVETVALHSGQSEVTAKGTYLVTADCRGSVEWKVNGDNYLQSYAMIIIQGGSEIQTVAFRIQSAGGTRP